MSPEPPEYRSTLEGPPPFHIDPPSYDEASRQPEHGVVGFGLRMDEDGSGSGTASTLKAGFSGLFRRHRLRNMSGRAHNEGQNKVGFLTAAVAFVTRRVPPETSAADGHAE